MKYFLHVLELLFAQRSSRFSWQESFYRNFKFLHKTRKNARWIMFLFWKQTLIRLKGYSCICFDLLLHLLSFWNGVYNEFSKSGVNFKKLQFFILAYKSLFPQNSNFFDWILGLRYPMITCELKSSDKRCFKTVVSPTLWLYHFCPKISAWLVSPYNLLQKQSLWTGKKN